MSGLTEEVLAIAGCCVNLNCDLPVRPGFHFHESPLGRNGATTQQDVSMCWRVSVGLEGKPLWLEEGRCSHPWPNEFKILLHHSMELKEGRRHFVMGLRSSVWSVQVPQDSPVSGEQPEVEVPHRGLCMVCWYRHQQRCHSGHLALALAK